MGLLSVSWGVGALVGPVVTGTVAELANDATAFLARGRARARGGPRRPLAHAHLSAVYSRPASAA